MAAFFQIVLMRVALAGLAVSLGVLVFRSEFVRALAAELLAKWKGLTALGRAVVCSFLLVGFLAADKTNGVNNLPPQQMVPPMAQQGNGFALTGLPVNGNLTNTMNLVQPQATFAERKTANWNIRGAWSDSFGLDFEDGWVFPWGTNHLAGVEVVSYGQVWPTPFDTNAVASIGVPVEIVPGLTTFGYEFTPSNSYRFAWTDAAVNRDTNNLISAALELFRNGDIAVTTNGVAALLPRELPFPHDGFGQDEEWVAANFTNAVEIAAAGGYAAWVDVQVGTGLTNGLYKVTATFSDDPPETVQLVVGDLSVAVTNSGEYVFLLEKGIDYEYGIIPFMTNVSYSAVDDVPQMWGGAGGLRSLPGDAVCAWSVDGGYGNEPQTDSSLGIVWWMPLFFGSPDVSQHLGPGDGPLEFTANLADCRAALAASYSWSASEGLTVHSPSAQTTLVSIESMPSWAQAWMSVTASIGNHELYSSLDGFTYGTNSAPQVHLSLDAPGTILVYTNVYTNAMSGLLSVRLTVDCETNGTLFLDCVQNAEKVLLKDYLDGTTITLPCEWHITNGFSSDLRVEGLVASESCGDVEFLASFVSGGNTNVSARVALTVADVWHLAVSEEPKDRWRNTLGVGESVMFYYRPRDMQIGASSTSGEFLPFVDGMLPYYAPHTQDVSNVTLGLGGVTCSVPFVVVAPEGIVVESIETNAYEFAGAAGIFEMTFHNRLMPTNVSFYAIETVEIPMVATNATGYYAQPEKSDELDHGKRGGGNWGGVGYGNEFVDYVVSGYVAPPWGEGGSFTWPIPVAWRGRHDEGVTNVFCHTDQRFELDANGTVRVFKFGYCGERTTNNVFNLTRIIP